MLEEKVRGVSVVLILTCKCLLFTVVKEVLRSLTYIKVAKPPCRGKSLHSKCYRIKRSKV